MSSVLLIEVLPVSVCPMLLCDVSPHPVLSCVSLTAQTTGEEEVKQVPVVLSQIQILLSF